MAEFGEDFGQKVDLTASIRNILRNYPEGTAIFKELIQNADDAGATTVSFCFDNRHHDASNLPDPRLAQFQGPSLLVYNNAVFSKEDLQSIQRIGDSLKNMDEQAKTKIGRFGIGFNAVYHWTELPSFITDRYLVMLDPQARFLPNVNPANPGKLVDWIANRKLLANFKDQFSPYALPGMDWSKPYAGTLFRLPLRTDDQAASSFLSKRSVNPQEMLAVLQTLASEASSMLLFLRTVSAIEVTVWNHGDTSPTRLYECHIRNMNSALQKKRSNDEVLGRNRPQYLATQVCLTQDFTLEIEAHDASSNSHTNEKWEVCTQFGGGEASVIASDPARAHLKLVPLGGVAANVLRSSASESLACEELGKAYCFLPLPVETGLSVMVNGFFELSSNRRDIWQESADMTGDGMARARWNLSLLRDVLAPCYTRLLVKLRDDMKFSLQYQKLWPKFDLPHPWCVIGNTTLVNVKNEKLLLVNIASTYSVWIEPARAVLLPLNSADTEGELIRFLQLAKAPVVTFQCAELHNSLVKGKLSEHVATPYLVRRLLKNSGCIPLHDMCRFLLAYVLSDLTSTDSLLELNGFSLLPLRNGKLGRLLVFTTLQVQSIAALLSMGFPMQDAIAALLQCKFNVDNASELLASNAINPSFLADSLFFMAPQEDLSVFKAAYSMIVDTDALGAAELERFRKHDFSTFMNLRFFAPELLSNLLRPILPRVFFEKPIVSAKRDLNENERVILAEFIPLLWKYLEAHPKALPPLYDHVSILPANSHADFCSISRMSNLIMPRKDDNSLPSELSVLLQRLKLRVVDQDLLQCDVNIFPASVWDYVHPPSLAGICASLSFCERDLGNEFFDLCDSLTPEQRDLLWNFFVSYARGDLTGEQKTAIRKLPIFKLAQYSNSLHSRYTALQQDDKDGGFSVLEPPINISSELFPSKFVHHSSPSEFELLKSLHLQACSKSNFYKHALIPHLPKLYSSFPQQTAEALLNIFREIRSLDKDFASYLRSVPCLPNSQWEIKYIHDLFDPSDADIFALMGDSLLPHESLRREDILLTLKQLGLRCTLDLRSLLKCARSIESIDISNKEVKTIKGGSLLRYLDNNINKLFGEDIQQQRSTGTFSLFSNIKSFFSDTPVSNEDVVLFKNEIRRIGWVPILSSPLHSFCPWKSDAAEVATAPPNVVRSVLEMWYCSNTFYIAQEAPKSPLLVSALGWDEPLSVAVITKQLLSLINMHQTLTESGSGDLAGLNSHLNSSIRFFYQNFDRADQAHRQEVFSALENEAWIWMGTKFLPSDKIAISSSINATPYLFQLPESMKIYSNLLQTFAIRNSFSPKDYVLALQRMAAEHSDNILNDALLSVAISMVVTAASASVSVLQTLMVYAPDVNGRLALANELVNDDVPWLSGEEFLTLRASSRLVHPKISSSVAEKLGVRSLRLSLVKSSLEQNLFDSPQSTGGKVESFGQAESLTNRLKTILDLYPDGSPILNELIQNADDAGATVVRILVDENHYRTESLMDARMEFLQGPSLVVQNDSMFTEADFKSLASVGQASKLDRLATTGRFGLGFNATYHLTDTPSFISGDYAVFFDPHCSFLPGATVNQPGIRIRYPKSDLNRAFANQFEPFQHFGFNFSDSYNGTLFRFPLRTPLLAKRSEICRRSYNLQDVYSLLGQLVDQFAHLCLFLRSVQNIEIYRCPGNISTPVLLYTSHVSTVKKSSYNDQSLFGYFDKSSSAPNTGGCSKESFYSKLMNTPDDRLPWMLCSKVIRIEDTMHKDAKVIPNTHERAPCVQLNYEVIQGLCGGGAKALAGNEMARHLKLVPYGCVASCVSRTVWSSMQEAPVAEDLFPKFPGQLFCFLPLPISTGLPIHINAYWELSSNRRDIWRGDDTKGEAKLRADWNVAVMRDVLAPLYMRLLLRLTTLMTEFKIPPDRRLILEWLPSPLPAAPWDTLAEAVYPIIKDKPLFWTLDRHLAARDIYVLEDGSSTSETWMEDIMTLEGVPVVLISSELRRSLLKFKCLAGVIDSEFIRRFFSVDSKKSCHPSISAEVGEESRLTRIAGLLQYAFKDLVANHSYEKMVGVKLLPLNNADIGTFGHQIDAETYFLASDLESKLLYQCRHRLVSSSSLSAELRKILSSAEVGAALNVRQMEPLDVLKQMSSMLPRRWLAKDTIFTARTVDIDDSWLVSTWTYILDNGLLDLYRGTMPLLPILPPFEQNLFEAKYLVKLAAEVPVVFNIDSLPPKVVEALSHVNIFVLDATIMKPFLHREVFNQLLQQAGVMGLLNALMACHNTIGFSSVAKWNADIKVALCEYLLTILIDISSMTAQMRTALRALPIWIKYGVNDVTALKSSIRQVNVMSDILAENCKLPPIDVPASLFDESFIVVQREVHRKAFIKLGIAECTSGQFFVQNVIPKLRVQQVFPDEDIQWISSFVLNNFSQLEAFDERVADSLRDCFIFANGTGSIRCSASSLYNPDEPLLRAFLPDSLFPSSVVCSSPIHIYHLKKMGLLKEVSPGDVLNAAKAIQETQDVYLSEINSSPSQWQGTEEYKSLVCRSVALLKYLGTNVDRLLSVVDAEGLAQFQRGSKTHDSDDEVSQDAAEGKLLGGDWGVELRSLSWIPVLIDPPSNLSHAGLPWPSRIHSSPFAAPSQSSLMNQAWYCSCNMRLCNVEINSSVLIALFGWSKALPGRSIALQLISISDEYQKIASIQVPSHDKNRLRLIEAYDRMYPPLLAKLHDAYIRESDRQVDLWTGALTNRRVVWINTGLFIEPGKVAFQGLPNVRTEPFLFVASTYMSRYKDMLLDVGVKEAFGPADLASMTRELYVQYGSTKLALDQVDAVISVSHALFTLIHDAVTAEGASFVEDAYVQELGAIYLPDSNDVLQVARSLTYNDAPWIVNSLGARIKVLKMVHGRVGMAAAKTLGAKSLRELLFAGEDMICPSVDSLGALIEDEGLLEVINSISSFASNVGAKKIELIFDDSTYPKESLLHPGLGEMQGCALMVFLDSVALNSEQITRFITPLADKNYGAIVSAETQCKNLASVFAITDCLSILSGNDFFVFDPSGRYLLGDVGATESHAEADAVITSKAETVPVARRFRIDKSIDRSDNSADLLNNFADQFVPFTCLPNHIIGNLMQERCQKKGMLLRLPLRLSASPLSKFVPTIDEAQTVFGSFRSSMISTVLFSPFMSAFRLSHISNMLYKEQLDVRIVSDDGAKQQKLKLLQSTGWEKQGITKLLSKTYVPPELYCSMKVCIQINTYPWIKPNLYLAHVLEQYVSVSSAQNSLTTNMLTLEETWLVCSCMGFSPLRDLALSEPYSSAGFKPFVSLAMQILEPWQLASHCTPMDTGLYYCGGILAGQTGFPFHVDGPFVQAIAVSKQRNVNEEPKSTSRQSLSNFESVSRLALNWNTHIFINALERLFPNTLINLLKRPFMDPSVSSLESSVKLKTLAGVYKYWIFNARLTNIAKRAVESSKLISFLSKEALYLLPFGSMQSLDKVLLNTHLNSGILIDYLSDFVPIGRAPMQVGLDLIAHGVPVSDLSAARLRALMKKDAHSHSQKLTRLLADSNTKTVAYRVLQEVIAFVTRDLAEMKEEGEFEKRRLYRTLQGVPALLMSDFSIRSFPTVVSDQICIVNDMSYFRILPPQVLNRIVHPWVLKHSSLFSQSLFRNTMFISTFNASFIRDVLPSLFPPQWNRADAACWKSSDYAVSNIPMDLVLYALWNETLLKEKHEDLLLMKDWPTVPVLTQHHRVLVSATLLPYLLMSPPGPAQDESRRTLRLSLKQKQDQYHSVPEIVVVDEEQAQGWKWIQENADEITSLEEELTEVNLENVQVEIPLSASPAPTATVVHVDDAPQNYGTFKLSTFNVLMKAGFLFVDVGLLKSVPPGVTSLRSSEHVGKRIVEVAHKLTELNVMLLHGDKSITPLLSLDRLSFKERNLLLLEAHEAHRAVAFDGALVEKTKALPLFTNSANGLPVSLSEVSGQGIFWCEDSRVLQLIEQFSAPAAIAATEGTALQATKPVILVNDAQLREVYRWLQVVELTAVVAMSKFIVPVIDSMNSRMRQLLLKELAVRWPVYRADTALVGLLKTKQWVPLWRRDSPEAWLQEGLTAAECNETYRRVNQTISWTNHELLDSLEGDTITNYTAPPSMRLAEHHVLFTDLGMLQELDFETLLKIACDIQADAVEARRLTSELSTVEGEIALRKCIDRGRRILMYVLDSDRLLEITQSNPMHVKKLGQVHFVPLSHPERMEDGGFIVYKDDVGAYRELVPRSSGALCFTLLPILDQSLTPPTLLFSQLGIISSPQEDVIMRHLRSLIQCVSLDRWNAPFPIDKAFAAIFTYLHDHWQGISPSIKNALQTSPLIPIGSHLVPPNRIFFRLTEDLSPFMHELPRMFGAHESLLKQLKVREAPTLQDYISFTKELAQEMHGQVLNVNEMRAIGTISSTLCSLLEQQQTVDMSILQSQLHMPDEHCVLHPVQSMVLSDDDSLQAKTLDAMQRLHMFCLHSSLHILGDALRLPKLSDVVVERIDQTKIRVERSDTNELQSARSKISHSKLALFLKRLLSSQQRHSVMTTKRTLLHAEQHQLAVDIALSTLQLLFVSRLHTSFYLIDISSRRVLQELTGDSGDEPAVFLDKHANPIVLYVSIGSLNGYLHSLDMLLACGLCTLLGLSKEAIFPVAEFLKSLGDTGSSTEDIERMLGLRSVTGQGSECNRGVVGQELVDMDYSLAELRPFRVFSAGEIVAYGDIPDQQQAGQTLYYGKVVSVGEANEAGLRKVEVRTEAGTQKLLSTQIYSFKSARTGGRDVGSSSRGSSTPIASFKATGAIQAAVTGSAVSANSTVGQQPTQTLASDLTVERGDILQAVQSLLVRVGLPLQLDQQNLMNRVLELEAMQKQAEETLRAEREHAAAAKQRAQTSLQRFTCSICLEKSIERSLVPCGHAFCEYCINHLPGSRCPTCRSHIERKQKLFLGESDEATV